MAPTGEASGGAGRAAQTEQKGSHFHHHYLLPNGRNRDAAQLRVAVRRTLKGNEEGQHGLGERWGQQARVFPS